MKQEKYWQAVKDTLSISTDELYEVLTITKDNPYICWNEEQQVLMGTYHPYPESYPAGSAVTLQWGDVWVFSPPEAVAWYQKYYGHRLPREQNWGWRFNALMGLAPDKHYTHFTLFWVNPRYLLRPAYNMDITSSTGRKNFDDYVEQDYRQWFFQRMQYAYQQNISPWTRLGYTYDWASEDEEYGLSEFLVRKNTMVRVQQTITVADFVAYLQISGKQSSKPK